MSKGFYSPRSTSQGKNGRDSEIILWEAVWYCSRYVLWGIVVDVFVGGVIVPVVIIIISIM